MQYFAGKNLYVVWQVRKKKILGLICRYRNKCRGSRIQEKKNRKRQSSWKMYTYILTRVWVILNKAMSRDTGGMLFLQVTEFTHHYKTNFVGFQRAPFRRLAPSYQLFFVFNLVKESLSVNNSASKNLFPGNSFCLYSDDKWSEDIPCLRMSQPYLSAQYLSQEMKKERQGLVLQPITKYM